MKSILKHNFTGLKYENYFLNSKRENDVEQQKPMIAGNNLRCKHLYIRRGGRLSDPLCFESPVNECNSIIACATGNGGKNKID